VLHSLMFVDGERAEVLLVAYLIAGIATFAAAFLPGNLPLYRVICLMLGGVMAAWATKVMMFGGMVFVNALVLIGPFALLIWGAAGMVRSIVNRPPARVYRPHPATRQLGGDASYQPHPPQGYAAYGPAPTVPAPRQYQPHPPQGYADCGPAPTVPAPRQYQPHPPQGYAAYGPAPTVPAPRQYQPGFVNVHHEYPAGPAPVPPPPTRREAAAFIAHSRRELDVPDEPAVPPRHRRAAQ
jgi:hypothetical protein